MVVAPGKSDVAFRRRVVALGHTLRLSFVENTPTLETRSRLSTGASHPLGICNCDTKLGKLNDDCGSAQGNQES